MSKVRVCFLGTPEFAVVALRALVQDEHYEVVGVVTQPDRPAGRKMLLTPSPVKTFCLAHGLRVISPESVNKQPLLQEIEKWGAEVAVVVAFGQILSLSFLKLFAHGAVNIHGSILPRWRGAAPIQRAIEQGDIETGVTLQKIVKELDAGDIIGIRKTTIKKDQHAMQLHDELAALSTELLHVELMDYVRGNLAPVPQTTEGLTYAKKIDKRECEIKWSEPAEHIHNKVRAFVMGPGTFTFLDGKKVKVHRTRAVPGAGRPGEVIGLTENSLVVATAQGALELIEVQPESRTRMKVSDFLKGHPLKIGDLFGAK